MTDKPKYKLADRSDWPVITQGEYLDLFSRTVQALLASGHYTRKCLGGEDAHSNGVSGCDSVVEEEAYHGHMEPSVIEPAEAITHKILERCGYFPPNLPHTWDLKEETND
jgi:hypothetical protein